MQETTFESLYTITCKYIQFDPWYIAMKCVAKHFCSCAGRSAQACESMLMLAMSMCSVGVWQDLLISILATCSCVMDVPGGYCTRLRESLSIYGQRWATCDMITVAGCSGKWTLIVISLMIFRYACLELAATPIFTSCEGLPVCCRTPLRRQRLLFEGSAEDCNSVYMFDRFRCCCVGGDILKFLNHFESRISATNWIQWNLFALLYTSQELASAEGSACCTEARSTDSHPLRLL